MDVFAAGVFVFNNLYCRRRRQETLYGFTLLEEKAPNGAFLFSGGPRQSPELWDEKKAANRSGQYEVELSAVPSGLTGFCAGVPNLKRLGYFHFIPPG
jgi:hypothetical protein